MATALSRLAASLARSFETRRLALALPDTPSEEILSSLGK